MKIDGTVVKKTIGKNSKTEYEAVGIKSDQKFYILRQPGQNPFKNPELEKLTGKKISAEGELVKDVFFVTKWEIIDR